MAGTQVPTTISGLNEETARLTADVAYITTDGKPDSPVRGIVHIAASLLITYESDLPTLAGKCRWRTPHTLQMAYATFPVPTL